MNSKVLKTLEFNKSFAMIIEYLINNNKVRLKDITNLFIDSGAGNDSFNIISQGNIADVINNRSAFFSLTAIFSGEVVLGAALRSAPPMLPAPIKPILVLFIINTSFFRYIIFSVILCSHVALS